jgi:hypothetical protein
MATRKKPVIPIAAAEYCGNCRFYRKSEDGGQCRLNPPVMYAEGESLFAVRPIVDEDDWCGQHQHPIQ